MKRKRFFLLFFCLAQMASHSQVLLKIEDDSLYTYTFKGGDEFNETRLNEDIWSNGLGWTRVLMSQDLAFSPNNVKLENGNLKLIANKEDSVYVLTPWEVDSMMLKKEKKTLPESKFATKYSAGCIITKEKLHYGFYEIRFKVEEGRGVWPAFWFFGGNKNDEIDIFELKGEKNDMTHVDTHCPYGCDGGYKNNLGIKTNWGGWLPLTNYLHEGYNVAALDWKEDELIWYMNGFPLAYFKGAFATPMNLYLNTSVAKDGGAFKPGPDAKTTWPNFYSVDYFRIWQMTRNGETIVLRKNDDFISSSELAFPNLAIPKRKRGYMYRRKELNNIEGTISVALSSANELNLIVLGKLAGPETTIKILANDKEAVFTQFNKEIKMPLVNLPDQIEIVIQIKEKEYRTKIKTVASGN